MTLTLDIRPELEAQLKAEAAKAGLDASTFILNAIEERMRQNWRGTHSLPNRLSTQEAVLLQKINQGLPEEVRQRYRCLVAKRRAETLTSEDHAELIALSDRIDETNARRIEHLAELAQLRESSLDDVMRQLGIKPQYV